MGLITPFTQPQDVRWQGPLRRHHIVFLVKTVVLILFIILAIVEYALLKSWWDYNTFELEWRYAPHNFWLRIGIALIPDALLTILTLILILNPLHHATYSFHPVFALVSSLVMMGLYVSVAFMNPFMAYSSEVPFRFSDKWYTLAFVEAGVQGLLSLLCIAMVVYSCLAVHKWRMAKKGAGKGGDIELRA